MATTISSTATSPYDVADSNEVRAASWTFNDFNDLTVPASATINGIELLIRMGGASLTDGATYFKVNNGTSDSSAKVANQAFPVYPPTGDITIGGSADLWGLTWNTTTANDITTKWDTAFHDSAGTAYFDHVQVRITYTEGAPDTSGPITITSGKISLTYGLITI